MSERRGLPVLLRSTTTQWVIGTVIAVILGIVLSGVLTRGVLNQYTTLLLLMTLALSWNLVGGFGGQFSLGHSIFVGVGGYATAIILTMFNTPLIPTILVAGVISSGIGVLLAYPLLRLRGPYLAVGSLGITLAALGWMTNWDFTHRTSSYSVPATLGISEIFIYSLLLAAVALLAVVFLVRSPLGLRLVALRDNEQGAASLGVRRVRTLIPVWALSGLLAGLMGSLTAIQAGSITVDAMFAIQFSLDAAIVCVIGGLGTISGPIYGAIFVFYLRFATAQYSSWAYIAVAVVVIVVVRFFPEGLAGLLGRLARLLGLRRKGITSSLSIAKEK
jgi:branched-chain amino acid transport system permease protein